MLLPFVKSAENMQVSIQGKGNTEKAVQTL